MVKVKTQTRRASRTTPSLRRAAVRPKVIGLVGGVASGKSTVAALFGGLGAAVIDADRIAHEVLRSKEVAGKIGDAWGGKFLRDGEPDRARIAEYVFEDPRRIERLNEWVHPPTRAEIRSRVRAACRRGAPLIVIDAPLLLEADLEDDCDGLLYVGSDASRRAARVRSRGWNATELRRREKLQLPLAIKRRRAHLVIENNGTLDNLAQQVRALFRRWTLSRAARPRGKHSGG